MRIAVDIDSTLYDFQALAREVTECMSRESGDRGEGERSNILMKGSRAPWPEWRTPGDLFGEELWSEVLDRTHAPEVILDQSSYYCAVKVINDLIAYSGYNVFFITSRDEDQTAEATREWLEIIGIEDPELICTGRAGSKIPTLIMKETNVLIDDRPQTLVDFAYEPNIEFVAAIGLRHDYNQGLSDIPKIDIVDDWVEVSHVLEKRIDDAYYRV